MKLQIGRIGSLSLRAVLAACWISCASPVLPLNQISSQTTELLESVGKDIWTYEILEAEQDYLYLANRSGHELTQKELSQAGNKRKFNYVPLPVPFKQFVMSETPTTQTIEPEKIDYPWLISTGKPQELYITSFEGSVHFLAPIYRLSLNQQEPYRTLYDPAKGYDPQQGTGWHPSQPLFPKAFRFARDDYPIRPQGMAYVPGQGWYLASMFDHRVFRSQGEVFSVWAGTKEAGYVDGPAERARFEYPRALVADLNGNVYLLEANKHRVRKISPDGTVSTLAGSTDAGFRDGSGSEARFKEPFDLAVNAKGEVFVSDTGNHRIRKITPDGTVSTVIGTGEPGVSEGELSQAKTGSPMGIDFGPDGTFYYIAEGSVFRAHLD